MAGHAESSKLSVNERLARAREEDLRRSRNLQAKLAREQDGSEDQNARESQRPISQSPMPATSSSRAGLMFFSATELAQKERDQRSQERQLKRQVAGPIPPHSWRDDFDRLSIRKGIASHLNRRRLQDLASNTSDLRKDEATQSTEASGNIGTPRNVDTVKRARAQHARTCAGLRSLHDSLGSKNNELSLRDMALVVIADAINCPSSGRSTTKGKSRAEDPEMDRAQVREVLEFLPGHMRQRLMDLCGRLAATDWPLSDRTAQSLIEVSNQNAGTAKQSEKGSIINADQDDWEADVDSARDLGSTSQSNHAESITTLDFSYSSISTRTLSRMLSSMGDFQLGISLRMLSLAGWNNISWPFSSSNGTPLDTTSVLSILSQLPNLEVLSLAGSSLSSATSGASETDHQRSAVFLRKLSRSLTKLKTLDLSFCSWVSAGAVLGVSWATPTSVALPRLENLLLVGCEALVDPRDRQPQCRDLQGRAEDVAGARSTFTGTTAGNHVAAWHATHSQRAMQATRSIDEAATIGVLYDAYTDTAHREAFDLFAAPPAAVQRQPARATFSDYINNTIQPAIISHMSHNSHGASSNAAPAEKDGERHGILMEYVRCPRSVGKVEMWQWQRARILEAVRGRTQPNARQRRWIEVWF